MEPSLAIIIKMDIIQTISFTIYTKDAHRATEDRRAMAKIRPD